MICPSTALIVDDEPHLRLFLKLILKKVGFTNCIEACNGQEAIDLYKENQPDLVLMDVNMPVKEGLEALAEIMEFDEEAVVVMMTSVAARHAVEKSAELGASYYIRKDTAKEDMIQTLTELIQEVWSQN